MVITNATWLSDTGAFKSGEIRITDSRIVGLSEQTRPAEESGPILNGEGFLVFPGLIDSHVHFREPGQAHKEGIRNGSCAALAGGVTTILDMPNNRPPCSTAQVFERKRNLFRRKCCSNWGLHLEATRETPEIRSHRTGSVKVYMAKSSTNPPIYDQQILAKIFEKYDVVTIHAEDETKFLPAGQNSPLCHHQVRPRDAVISALEKTEHAYLSLPRQLRPRLVICHVSTADEIEWVNRMKNEQLDIFAETCPHYWSFTQDDFLSRGSILKVNPPLRTESDKQRILDGLGDGTIDFVSTDHAPHTKAEKAETLSPPSGIASVEWFMPLLLALVENRVIDWGRFFRLGCVNAASCYAIPDRAGIRLGHFADLVLVERQPFTKTSPAPVKTKAAVDPYPDVGFDSRVFATIINGKLVFRDNKVLDCDAGQEVYS